MKLTEEQFRQDVFEQLESWPLGSVYQQWKEHRRSLVMGLQSSAVMTQRSPDYILLQAILQLNGDASEYEFLDEIIPDFRSKLRQYRGLQASLQLDLQDLMKAVQANIAPFKPYL